MGCRLHQLLTELIGMPVSVAIALYPFPLCCKRVMCSICSYVMRYVSIPRGFLSLPNGGDASDLTKKGKKKNGPPRKSLMSPSYGYLYTPPSAVIVSGPALPST